MITANVLRRTFLIAYNSSIGSCFVMDHGGRQYIITARHVLAGLQDGGQISIGHNKSFVTTNVRLVGEGSNGIDLSVVAIETPLYRGSNIEQPEGDHWYMIGQDAYFLGFPFGIYTDVGEINNHFPIPIVKKAIFAGKLHEANADGVLLDGINNKGFSGGPVVYESRVDRMFRVAAVVSGYKQYRVPVYEGEEPTALSVNENTGIIQACGIKHAIELIDANPIGAPLS